MTIKIISLIFLVSILYSCENVEKKHVTNLDYSHEESNKTVNIFTSKEEKSKILLEGDINNYQKLKHECFHFKKLDELLFYSTVMSREFGYIQAYFDVYITLVQYYCYRSGEFKITKSISDLAIQNLLLAYKNEHHQAISLVNKYNITSDSNSLELMTLICNR